MTSAGTRSSKNAQVTHGRGVSTGLGVAVLDSGELEHALRGRGGDDTGSAGGGDEGDVDGADLDRKSVV